VPEERLIDIFNTQKASGLPDSLTEAKRLIETNEPLHTRAKEAERICISLGLCGNRQLTIDLVRALHETLVRNSHASSTILYTRGAPELDLNLFPEMKIEHHHPQSSPTIPIENFNGAFTPELNAEFLNADLNVIVGELKPHPFLQYSGLCDIVFPGLASENSAQNHLTNRTSFSISDLRKERLQITASVGDVFALGAVLDSGGSPLQVAFGSLSESMLTLGNGMQTASSRDVVKAADIVVISAGGMPQDELLLEAVEVFPVGIAALKRNGALIVAAECGKGHGDTEFYEWCAEKKEARHLEARLRHHFNYNGFKAAFLRRTLDTHRVYLVSTISDYYVENVFGMRAAPTVNAALQTAQRAIGSQSTISVIPDAGRVILRQQTPAQ
jgi:nickel-dependent lactate racemase